MKNRVRIRKDAAASPEVTRLHDMVVEEVSLVDRAANKRKFLIVKNETGELGAELVSDGKGGLVPIKKDLVTGEGNAEDAHPAAVAPAQPPAQQQQPAPVAGGPLNPESKAMLMGGLQKGLEHVQNCMKAIQAAPEAPDAPKGHGAYAPAVQAAAEHFAQLAAPPQPPQDQMSPNVPANTQGAAAAAADAGRQSAKRDTTADDVKKLADAIQADITGLGAARGAVEKVGAKMAKERFSRFQEALDKLMAIAKELTSAEAAQETEEPGKKKPAAAPPASPPVAAAPPPAAAMARSVPTFVAGYAGGVARPAQKSDLSAEALAVIETLEKQLSELTAVTKRQADDLGEVARLRKFVPDSNAIPVEGDRIAARTGADDVVWPRDMNSRPANKRGTAKETFFDK